jgi:2-methylcitrate dehydratase
MTTTRLPADTNQVRGLAQYALGLFQDKSAPIGSDALERVEAFLLDSVACAVSALALGTTAPTVLRQEALEYSCDLPSRGATVLGSSTKVWPEKAVAANSSAAREWDSNGTNFGYNPTLGFTRGEFGHNDFYPVVLAAAEQSRADGLTTLKGMLIVDEIRGRLAEVFALREYKIDHVLHGAIASAIVYGAMLGASVDAIESAVGMTVAHYVPFRAIRAGKQLSDSKGASAALSAEAAVMSVHRAMRGFRGPADVFRNPQAVFCLFEPPSQPGRSPFDLVLGTGGDDFAILDMHFKLGLYEHQSAGAIQGLIDVLTARPELVEDVEGWQDITIEIYEPAFSIIGDPAKRDPQTRQSADHSMVYIIATLIRKALERKAVGWTELMLLPDDYSDEAIQNSKTREIISRIHFRHGGAEYDTRYPDGIPTQLTIRHERLGEVSSGLVMYPLGHVRNTNRAALVGVLSDKFMRLASLAVDDVDDLRARFSNLAEKSADEVQSMHDFSIRLPEVS